MLRSGQRCSSPPARSGSWLRAVVVAVPCAVAAAHLVTVGADPEGAALDQALEQPRPWFFPARAPLAVVVGHPAGGLELLVGDDGPLPTVNSPKMRY